MVTQETVTKARLMRRMYTAEVSLFHGFLGKSFALHVLESASGTYDSSAGRLERRMGDEQWRAG